MTIANTIAKVVGKVKYEQRTFEIRNTAGIIFVAKLQMSIDTNSISDWLKLDDKERNTLIMQSEALQKTAIEKAMIYIAKKIMQAQLSVMMRQ